MPALSPTMTQGNIVAWLKKEGEPIQPGDAVMDIETDKATLPFEAQEEGFLARIVVQNGSQNVQCGDIIGYYVEEEAELENVEALLQDAKPEQISTLETSMSDSKVTQGNSTDKKVESTASLSSAFITPAAGFHMKTLGITVNQITPTGPGGRILKQDVFRAAKSSDTAPKASTAAASPKKSVPKVESSRPYHDIPLTSMRKVIAHRLHESKSTIPHAYSSIDCRLDTLISLRRRMNASLDSKVSINDLIIKAAASALRRVPQVNSTYNAATREREQQENIDISVAVATPGGLITPIVTKVDTKSISDIAASVRDLATRAKENKLKPEEFQGGSFTISNLGMYGISAFSAVINPPQACILAVGGGQTSVGLRDGKLCEETVLTVTLSSDGRVVSESDSHAFLEAFQACIEIPELMMLYGLSQ